MRAILALPLLLLACAVQAQTPPKRVVFLDHPGVLEALANDQPERYRRVGEILRMAETLQCEELPRAIKAGFDAEAWCGLFLLTSLPPKAHLTFTIDNTVYVTNVVQRGFPGAIFPAQIFPAK